MRILYLAAGAAGMYCGSCLHDNALARGLMELGEEVWLTPTYTPLRTDAEDVSRPRVFLGGINLYLDERWPPYRRAPGWVRHLLDRPAVLRRLAGRGAAVDPADLGPLTVATLRGEAGPLARGVAELVDWIVDDARPDIVHLSNSMLLGAVARLTARNGPPIVCSLSGEDLFVEQLREPYYSQARELLRRRASEVAGFTALNGYYADFMSEYLSIARAKVHVIPTGLDLSGYAADQVARPQPARIGFLARICRDKGLHNLVAAGELLSGLPDLPPWEIVAAGYLGARDRAYLADLESRVARGALADKFRYVGELDRPAKIAFLQSLTLFTTPTEYREAKGLPMLEALAAGAPVVLPAHGSFPELVDSTGGGLLCAPRDPTDLAAKLAELLRDPARAAALGAAGQAAVRMKYSAQRLAEATRELYRSMAANV